MAELERALRELGDELTWPSTPDLAAAVTARLAAGPASRGPAPAVRRRPSRRLLAGLVAALVLLPGAALAVPGPRHAILDALGLRHVTVQQRPQVPAGANPRLGGRTTLANARRLAGFAPRVPAALGPPDAVFVNQAIVTLRYDAAGVILAQAPGALQREVLRKVITVDQRIRPVRVGGRPGVFIPARHDYVWTDATGPLVRSGPALVWEQDGLVLRLEGPRTLAAALRIAESVR
jgi:hypothetical protein